MSSLQRTSTTTTASTLAATLKSNAEADILRQTTFELQKRKNDLLRSKLVKHLAENAGASAHRNHQRKQLKNASSPQEREVQRIQHIVRNSQLEAAMGIFTNAAFPQMYRIGSYILKYDYQKFIKIMPQAFKECYPKYSASSASLVSPSSAAGTAAGLSAEDIITRLCHDWGFGPEPTGKEAEWMYNLAVDYPTSLLLDPNSRGAKAAPKKGQNSKRKYHLSPNQLLSRNPSSIQQADDGDSCCALADDDEDDDDVMDTFYVGTSTTASNKPGGKYVDTIVLPWPKLLVKNKRRGTDALNNTLEKHKKLVSLSTTIAKEAEERRAHRSIKKEQQQQQLTATITSSSSPKRDSSNQKLTNYALAETAADRDDDENLNETRALMEKRRMELIFSTNDHPTSSYYHSPTKGIKGSESKGARNGKKDQQQKHQKKKEEEAMQRAQASPEPKLPQRRGNKDTETATQHQLKGAETVTGAAGASTLTASSHKKTKTTEKKCQEQIECEQTIAFCSKEKYHASLEIFNDAATAEDDGVYRVACVYLRHCPRRFLTIGEVAHLERSLRQRGKKAPDGNTKSGTKHPYLNGFLQHVVEKYGEEPSAGEARRLHHKLTQDPEAFLRIRFVGEAGATKKAGPADTTLVPVAAISGRASISSNNSNSIFTLAESDGQYKSPVKSTQMPFSAVLASLPQQQQQEQKPDHFSPATTVSEDVLTSPQNLSLTAVNDNNKANKATEASVSAANAVEAAVLGELARLDLVDDHQREDDFNTTSQATESSSGPNEANDKKLHENQLRLLQQLQELESRAVAEVISAVEDNSDDGTGPEDSMDNFDDSCDDGEKDVDESTDLVRFMNQHGGKPSTVPPLPLNTKGGVPPLPLVVPSVSSNIQNKNLQSHDEAEEKEEKKERKDQNTNKIHDSGEHDKDSNDAKSDTHSIADADFVRWFMSEVENCNFGSGDDKIQANKNNLLRQIDQKGQQQHGIPAVDADALITPSPLNSPQLERLDELKMQLKERLTVMTRTGDYSPDKLEVLRQHLTSTLSKQKEYLARMMTGSAMLRNNSLVLPLSNESTMNFDASNSPHTFDEIKKSQHGGLLMRALGPLLQPSHSAASSVFAPPSSVHPLSPSSHNGVQPQQQHHHHHHHHHHPRQLNYHHPRQLNYHHLYHHSGYAHPHPGPPHHHHHHHHHHHRGVTPTPLTLRYHQHQQHPPPHHHHQRRAMTPNAKVGHPVTVVGGRVAAATPPHTHHSFQHYHHNHHHHLTNPISHSSSTQQTVSAVAVAGHHHQQQSPRNQCLQLKQLRSPTSQPIALQVPPPQFLYAGTSNGRNTPMQQHQVDRQIQQQQQQNEQPSNASFYSRPVTPKAGQQQQQQHPISYLEPSGSTLSSYQPTDIRPTTPRGGAALAPNATAAANPNPVPPHYHRSTPLSIVRTPVLANGATTPRGLVPRHPTTGQNANVKHFCSESGGNNKITKADSLFVEEDCGQHDYRPPSEPNYSTDSAHHLPGAEYVEHLFYGGSGHNNSTRSSPRKEQSSNNNLLGNKQLLSHFATLL